MSWRVAASLLVLRNQIDTACPGRSRASDGTIGDAAHQLQGSDSDHNPWVTDLDGQGVVTALDITHDPAHGCDIRILSNELARSRDRRIKYLIANGLIMSGQDGPMPWIWRLYLGDPHTNHIHISVLPRQPLYDSAARWDGVATNPQGDDMSAEDTQNIAKLVHHVIANDDGSIPGPIPASLARIESRLAAILTKPAGTLVLDAAAEDRIARQVVALMGERLDGDAAA